MMWRDRMTGSALCSKDCCRTDPRTEHAAGAAGSHKALASKGQDGQLEVALMRNCADMAMARASAMA